MDEEGESLKDPHVVEYCLELVFPSHDRAIAHTGHNGCDYMHKTCTRSNSQIFSMDWGGPHRVLPIADGLLKINCW